MPGAAATTPKPKRKRKVKLRIRRSPPQESEKRLLRELLNHADEKQIGALYNWAAGTRYHRKSGEQLLEATVAVCERRIGTDMTLQQLLKAQRMPIGCLRKMLQTRAVAASDIASSKSELANEVLKLCGYDVLPDAEPPRDACPGGAPQEEDDESDSDTQLGSEVHGSDDERGHIQSFIHDRKSAVSDVWANLHKSTDACEVLLRCVLSSWLEVKIF